MSRDDDELAQGGAEPPPGHEEPPPRAVVDAMRAPPGGKFANVGQMVRHYAGVAFGPVIVKQNGAAAAAGNIECNAAANLVVRIPINVNQICQQGIAIGGKNKVINVDIGVSDNSRNILPGFDQDDFELPLSQAYEDELANWLRVKKIMFHKRVIGTERRYVHQAPHWLAYAFGMLCGINTRIQYERTIAAHGGAAYWDTLIGNGLAAGAAKLYDGPAIGGVQVFGLGAIAFAGAAANAFSGFAQHGTNQLMEQHLADEHMWMFLSDEQVVDPVICAAMNILQALITTTNWNVLGLGAAPSIQILRQGNAPGGGAGALPAAGGMADALYEQGCAFLGYIVNQLFAGNKGLMWRYIMAGNGLLIRPHCCYSEGGLMRKALRRVVMPMPRFLMMMPARGEMEYDDYVNPLGSGIALGLATLAETMIIQSAFSTHGAVTVNFSPAMPGDRDDPVDLNPVFSGEWCFQGMQGAAFPVGPAYVKLLLDRAVRERLDEGLIHFYTTDVNQIVRMMELSARFGRVTLNNVKRRKIQMHRGAGMAPGARPMGHEPRNQFKFRIGFLNRFHDPELAYILGVTAGNAAMLQGVHSGSVVNEVKAYVAGNDLRELPLLMFLHNNGLDQHVRVERENPRKNMWIMMLDGRLRMLRARPAIDDLLWGWNEHGGVPRPYSAYISDSKNIAIQSLAGAGEVTVAVQVTSALRWNLSYAQVPERFREGRQGGGL
uniref:Capsid protein n=1 Tax=Cryptotermes secundus trichomonasvirus 1 TaxID=3133527 RepID=A0AAT9JNH6_9VIRU